MSGLDTALRKFANTPGDKFQDQWMLIQIMQTNRSTINGANIKNITPKNNTWQRINRENYYNLEKLNYSLSIQ